MKLTYLKKLNKHIKQIIKDRLPFRAFVAVKNIRPGDEFICYEYGGKRDDPKVIDSTTIIDPINRDNDELTVPFIPEPLITSLTANSTTPKKPIDLATKLANTSSDSPSSSTNSATGEKITPSSPNDAGQSYYREWDIGELKIKRRDKKLFLEKGKTYFTLQNQAVSTVAKLSNKKTSIIITFDRSKLLKIISFDPIYIKGVAKSIELTAQSIHGEQPVRYDNEEIEFVTTEVREPTNPRKRWSQRAISENKAKIPNIGEPN